MSAMPASVLVEGTSEIRNWIVTAAAANLQEQSSITSRSIAPAPASAVLWALRTGS